MWIRPATAILQLEAIDAVTGMDVVYKLQSGNILCFGCKGLRFWILVSIIWILQQNNLTQPWFHCRWWRKVYCGQCNWGDSHSWEGTIWLYERTLRAGGVSSRTGCSWIYHHASTDCHHLLWRYQPSVLRLPVHVRNHGRYSRGWCVSTVCSKFYFAKAAVTSFIFIPIEAAQSH